MRSLSTCVTIATLFLLSPLTVFGVERVFCEGDDCTDDRLKVVFVASGTSELAGAMVGDEFTLNVNADIVSDEVQGWSMALATTPLLPRSNR